MAAVPYPTYVNARFVSDSGYALSDLRECAVCVGWRLCLIRPTWMRGLCRMAALPYPTYS